LSFVFIIFVGLAQQPALAAQPTVDCSERVICSSAPIVRRTVQNKQARPAQKLRMLEYNHPGLVVDLGVGLWAWPLPMDFDGDGDHDLVVSCPDKPYNGTYWFENITGNVKLPVFKPAVRIGNGHRNIRVSFVDQVPRVLTPGTEFRNFRQDRFGSPGKFPVSTRVHITKGKIRANQWHLVDYDGDRALDLVVGIGDWSDYGWDDAFNAKGEWTRGPLRGFVYLLRNKGSNEKPIYEKPIKVQAAEKAVEVFGWPSPNFADFDGDGDLDLLCGEFLDRFSYFENVGTRTKPRYAAGRFLSHAGQPIRMDLQMIVPVAIDWDKDGDIDLIVGDEDGRVAFVEHTGKLVDHVPQFLPPKYFQQQAREIKFGALATPFCYDWDGDGDEDILSGNTAGYIGFFENLGGGENPKWAAAKHLTADGHVIRIQAGPNGSIQGPCEAKWGYTTLSVADWNHDSLPDLIVNSIWGEILWYQNVGTRQSPKLAAAKRIQVDWPSTPTKPAWTWWKPQGRQLVTQWRTTPCATDFNKDGLIDLVMLDHEGYLSLYERRRVGKQLKLLPPRRIFVDDKGKATRLNPGRAGRSGRRKLAIVDWDGDGRLDFLANSVNADLLRNTANRDGKTVLKNLGSLSSHKLAGHTSSPTVVDWNRDGIPDLLVGAEDGHFYYMRNPRTK
jgi:hypothetical protein